MPKAFSYSLSAAKKGVVQLYIRFEKALPFRNGVRLHLTFLRLAALVGIGHEGPGAGKIAAFRSELFSPPPGFRTM